jgi:DNA-binding GntR family transcriptional regulator
MPTSKRSARPAPAAAGPPATIASYVTEELRSAILDGRYPVGSRLDQVALAGEFGASIIPVRESLRQLEAEGLVRITPRRGAFVVEPTDEEVMELYKIRAALEAFATREAVPRMTRAELDELAALGDELERIAQRGSHARWTRVNREWHFKLYGAAQSALLLQFLNLLWDRCTLTSHMYVRDPGHRAKSVADHARVLKAARRGDADEAARVVAQHVEQAMHDLVDGSVDTKQKER